MGNCGGLDVVHGGATSGCRGSERLAQHYGADAVRDTSNTASEVTKYRRKRRKMAAQGGTFEKQDLKSEITNDSTSYKPQGSTPEKQHLNTDADDTSYTVEEYRQRRGINVEGCGDIPNPIRTFDDTRFPSPAWYAYGKISLGHQLGHHRYSFWAANCWAILVYSILPSLYLLRGASLFPQISSMVHTICICDHWKVHMELCGVFVVWWHNFRLVERAAHMSSYLFAFIDTILHSFGYSNLAFVITAKVANEDVSQRHKKEIMEFGDSSPMLTPLATLALPNLYCFAGFLKEAINGKGIAQVYDTLTLQILLCGALILINLPLYQALYLRKDKGKIPASRF
ncbi:hypothetical protein C1H46_017699 [Malus baccata]|uniref:Uncharacterized protein n=1 Tax=Malus baccata TaxID=106549 RepID=A0A540MD67_MALBA|nr:hypothetical protein C1H46_017699 [Malus baccata]